MRCWHGAAESTARPVPPARGAAARRPPPPATGLPARPPASGGSALPSPAPRRRGHRNRAPPGRAQHQSPAAPPGSPDRRHHGQSAHRRTRTPKTAAAMEDPPSWSYAVIRRSRQAAAPGTQRNSTGHPCCPHARERGSRAVDDIPLTQELPPSYSSRLSQTGQSTKPPITIATHTTSRTTTHNHTIRHSLRTRYGGQAAAREPGSPHWGLAATDWRAPAEKGPPRAGLAKT
jgi:hypothetical protein